MMRPLFAALFSAVAFLALPACKPPPAQAIVKDNAPERAKFYADYNARVLKRLNDQKAALEKELAGPLEETAQKAKAKELEDVNRHLQDPEFFSFKTEAEVPADLKWEDGMDQPEIGSPNAKKGGTFHSYIQGNAYPPNIRSCGRDANNSFRSNHWDDVEINLVGLHPNTGKLIPAIADRWAVGPDQQSVFFHIDSDARWSDGKKITTRDFLMTFYVYLSNYLSEPFYRTWYGEQYWGITTYGDSYLCVRNANPKAMAGYFASIPAFQEDFYKEFGPDFESAYNWRPRPATGAYVIRPEDIIKGRSISLSRVKDWWARDKKFYRYRFNADRLEYALVRDEEKVFQLFLRGDIDTYLLSEPTKWYEKTEVPEVFKGYIEKATFYNEYPTISRGLYLNEANPMLADQNIRIGLQYASNWEKVVRIDMRGDAERLNIHSEGYGMYSDPSIRTRPFSVDLAREAFAKAGFTKTGPDGILMDDQGRRLSFSVNYARLPIWMSIMLRLKEEAKLAGVEFRLEPMDATASFQKVSRKEHEIALAGWGAQPPFPDYYQEFYSQEAYEPGSTKPRPNTNNISSFADKSVDPILERNRNAATEEDVRSSSFEMEKIIHDRALWVPAFYRPFYRTGYWRWIRWPEDFNVRLGNEPEMNYVYWIDEDIKKETQEARKTGKTFTEVNAIYDQYRKKNAPEQ